MLLKPTGLEGLSCIAGQHVKAGSLLLHYLQEKSSTFLVYQHLSRRERVSSVPGKPKTHGVRLSVSCLRQYRSKGMEAHFLGFICILVFTTSSGVVMPWDVAALIPPAAKYLQAAPEVVIKMERACKQTLPVCLHSPAL